MKKDSPANAGKMQQAGRFEPGKSGNPGGKKPGTLNKVTKAAQTLLDGEAEALTRKAVEMAGEYGRKLVEEEGLSPAVAKLFEKLAVPTS